LQLSKPANGWATLGISIGPPLGFTHRKRGGAPQVGGNPPGGFNLSLTDVSSWGGFVPGGGGPGRFFEPGPPPDFGVFFCHRGRGLRGPISWKKAPPSAWFRVWGGATKRGGLRFHRPFRHRGKPWLRGKKHSEWWNKGRFVPCSGPNSGPGCRKKKKKKKQRTSGTVGEPDSRMAIFRDHEKRLWTDGAKGGADERGGKRAAEPDRKRGGPRFELPPRRRRQIPKKKGGRA